MKAIELFAGAGGLGLGVSRAGFTPIEVVEWDRWCCDTIRENRARGLDGMRHWPQPREADVRSISFDGLAGIDLVTGGPPCQPFSLGGRHRAQHDHRDMWPETVRIVRETQPSAFIFENVKGLTRETFAIYFSYIFLQLTYPEIVFRGDETWLDHRARLEQHHTSSRSSGLSYRVLPPKVLNAANYGVPQKRARVFFVGFRSDLGVEWSFPRETHSRDALLWDQYRGGDYWDRHEVAKSHRLADEPAIRAAGAIVVRPTTLPWTTTRDALIGLPDPELSPGATHGFKDHRLQVGARSYQGHTGSPLDEPAKTLKAGVHGVPGGENMLRRPDGSVRYFTVRESARLQTFPDDYAFHGSWSETMRQLGNAVPVDLAHVVASSVREHLDRANAHAGRV
ncbi:MULTISPECIES: DNA cytosine methyltransferase [unclassified Mesorhizobium]|uniref:DNA cytosine methyltransferase n=1 Tax=unclassified Mesorhizobium TaxID=325217 RepID=UPI000FCC8478|nr:MULTISPECIES: DNA cytosine methyltransferase [unclassified Mesorhizobium]TGP24874.1 DNA (cytosine-5-)-methyltransferase [Mesorhizobium sp. M1D.F.Ca.ET.231.01.1.1]TGP36197.1 DNA (cytosine-5-)-methyltransferase [Mesorhizobium sp. M1D.F.Ca.ET.234.01.1.1]TGS49699.1 DNA (cytosine-5-)-methyltransferase [Mesorhizobium sp. M1D.F.Ca.ET.184.01.1.1]TGS64411.1 DNA (cytosine-5-)-methyltransferase [Mesorhizobium sp. M1D.F.Ca.ET.183.01.1.1]